jgi:phage baseplate assembly protein W
MTIINPTRIYSDLDLGFIAHPNSGDLVKVLDINSVKQSVKLLVFTMFGERRFAPDLGSPTFGLLFEPLDQITSELIKQSILQVLNNNELRIIVNELVVTPNYDQNSYAITLYFTIVNIPLPINFSFSLARLR